MHKTNQKLADLIISSCGLYNGILNISSNPNPGLTKFLIDHESELSYSGLSSNSNPELTDLIIRNKGKLNHIGLSRNTNKKLLGLIRELGCDMSFIGSNPIIATIDKDRTELLLRELTLEV